MENFYRSKQCLSYLLVSDKMPTDSDSRTLAVVTQNCVLLLTTVIFKIIMIIDGCINAYILFMGS